MHAMLNWIQVKPSDLRAYLEVRSHSINPAMRSTDGFGESILLQDRKPTEDGNVQLVLVNTWRDADAQRAWEASQLHRDAKAPAAAYVQRLKARLYERVDDASFSLEGAPVPHMGALGFHQVMRGRGDEYLARRRDIVHPSMAAAPGCLSVWVYRDPEATDRFVVFFQWESDRAADTFFATPAHSGPLVNAVRSITEGEIASTRYDILELPAELPVS
jgi:heme-degrading monooxygenase HmoA